MERGAHCRRSTLNWRKTRHVAGCLACTCWAQGVRRPGRGPSSAKIAASATGGAPACASCRAAPHPPPQNARPRAAGRCRAPPCASPTAPSPATGVTVTGPALPQSRTPSGAQETASLVGPRWVVCSRGIQGAAGEPAAVGVEGCVAFPRGDAVSLIANSTSGTRTSQSSARSPAKERIPSVMAQLTRSTLMVFFNGVASRI